LSVGSRSLASASLWRKALRWVRANAAPGRWLLGSSRPSGRRPWRPRARAAGPRRRPPRAVEGRCPGGGGAAGARGGGACGGSRQGLSGIAAHGAAYTRIVELIAPSSITVLKHRAGGAAPRLVRQRSGTEQGTCSRQPSARRGWPCSVEVTAAMSSRTVRVQFRQPAYVVQQLHRRIQFCAAQSSGCNNQTCSGERSSPRSRNSLDTGHAVSHRHGSAIVMNGPACSWTELKMRSRSLCRVVGMRARPLQRPGSRCAVTLHHAERYGRSFQVFAVHDTGQAPLTMGSEPTVARCLHRVVVAMSYTNITVFGAPDNAHDETSSNSSCNLHNARALSCTPLASYPSCAVG